MKKVIISVIVLFSLNLYGNKSVELKGEIEDEPIKIKLLTKGEIRKAIDLKRLKEEDGRYVQVLDNNYKIVYTLEPKLQRFIFFIFKKYKVPLGSSVVLNSRTGRVLAIVHYCESKDCKGIESPFVSKAPSASLFKIVTASATLESTEITPNSILCYHGGTRKITLSLLIPDPKKDKLCIDFAGAFGFSVNTVFARLGVKLGVEKIKEYAERFGFNRKIPFDIEVERSIFEVPKSKLELGKVSAGFWLSYLSVFHAAMIAQAIAQNGNMLRPYMIEEVLYNGKPIFKERPKFLRTVIKKETAQKLKPLLLATTTRGTARNSFFDRRGRAFLPKIKVGGKTGTLHTYRPYREYSWFVGIAPLDRPKIAFSVLLVNEPRWRIKAHFVGREIARFYFKKISPLK